MTAPSPSKALHYLLIQLGNLAAAHEGEAAFYTRTAGRNAGAHTRAARRRRDALQLRTLADDARRIAGLAE